MKRFLPVKKILTGVLVAFCLAGVWAACWRWQQIRLLTNSRSALIASGEKLLLSQQSCELSESVRQAGSAMYQPMMEIASVSVRVKPREFRGISFVVAPSLQPSYFKTQEVERQAWIGMTQAVIRLDGSIQKLHDLMSSPGRAGFALPYEQGWNLTSGHSHSVRNAAIVLSSSVVERLSCQDRAKALRNLITLLRLPRLLEEDRIPLSELLRMGCASSGFAAVWEALQHEGWNDAELASMDVEVGRIDFFGPVARAIRMQRAMDLMHLQNLRESQSDVVQTMKFGVGNPSFKPITIPGSPLEIVDFVKEVTTRPAIGAVIAFQALAWRWFWSYEDERLLLQNFDVALQTATERTNHWSQTAARLGTIRRSALARYHAPFLGRPQFGSAFDRLLQRAAATEMERRLCRTAIAVERYKLRHGGLPESIARLVPEFMSSVPEDLFSQGAVKYRVLNQGHYLLYADGFNGSDDGGSSVPMPENEMPFRGGWAGSSGEAGMLNTRDMVWPIRATEEEIKRYSWGRSLSPNGRAFPVRR